jgi:hypothetical protein
MALLLRRGLQPALLLLLLFLLLLQALLPLLLLLVLLLATDSIIITGNIGLILSPISHSSMGSYFQCGFFYCSTSRSNATISAYASSLLVMKQLLLFLLLLLRLLLVQPVTC